MSMTEISSLDMKFDLVYSSLAMHYIEDFRKLMEDIFRLLNKGGIFLFSQEYLIKTASLDNAGHFFDCKGN